MSSKIDAEFLTYGLIALPALLSITLLILSSVALGSVNKLQESTEQKNAQRSSTGMVVISIGLVLAAAYGYYKQRDLFRPKPSFIYYF